MIHYLGVAPHNVEAKSRGIFNVQTLCKEIPHMEPLMSKYLDLDAQSPDDLGAAFGGGQPGEVNAGSVLTALHQRPVLLAADGRAIITDPVLYAERASIGPLFVVSAGAEEKSNELFGAFGFAFEDYANQILGSMYPETPGLARRFTLRPKRRDAAGNIAELSDACLNDVTEEGNSGSAVRRDVKITD